MNKEGTELFLSGRERFSIVFFAAAMICSAFFTATTPARLTTQEIDAAGKKTKVTITEQPRNEIAMLLFGIGAAMLFLGINGSRLSKLTVGAVTAETRSPEVKAADDTAKKNEKPKEVTPPEVEPPEEETQPTTNPEGKVILENTAMSVFSRDAVPERVLQDALDRWPMSSAKPKDLSQLEFAARKSGKGNHPWILKFTGFEPIKVSYGGQSKTAPTVQQGVQN